MTRYEYRVVDIGPSGVEVLVQPSALHNVPCERWTYATATEYARVKGARLPAGRELVVSRRRARKSPGDWMPFRRYLVGDDGIVRRTDQ